MNGAFVTAPYVLFFAVVAAAFAWWTWWCEEWSGILGMGAVMWSVWAVLARRAWRGKTASLLGSVAAMALGSLVVLVGSTATCWFAYPPFS